MIWRFFLGGRVFGNDQVSRNEGDLGLGGRSERLLLAASPNARENAGRVSGLKPRQHQPGFLANVAGTPVGLGPLSTAFSFKVRKVDRVSEFVSLCLRGCCEENGPA